MSDPVITPDDLGTYLGVASIDEDRATFVIAQAQALCESIVSPLPAAAAAVVLDVATRAWDNPTSKRTATLGSAGVGFGPAGGMIGGLYLTRANKADLRRFSGGGGAFTIDVTPTAATLAQPPWDSAAAVYLGDWDVPA